MSGKRLMQHTTEVQKEDENGIIKESSQSRGLLNIKILHLMLNQWDLNIQDCFLNRLLTGIG